MGEDAAATRWPNSATTASSTPAPPSQSIRSATHASASNARGMPAATAPNAHRTDRASWSVTRASPTMEITMALRGPIFKNSWRPVGRSNSAATISSPGRSDVRFTPTMKSSNPIRRSPSGPTTTITAFNAASTGSVSPAGDAVPRLPPNVPALRMGGDPTVRAAWAKAGAASASGPDIMSV